MPGPYEEFITEELIYLWGQLWDAYQSFLDSTWEGTPVKRWEEGGTWSGRCEGLATRIKIGSELVGSVSWMNVPITALIDGWFSWANQMIGIMVPNLPNDDDLRFLRAKLQATIDGVV
jgi:hypothetical protein